MNKDNIEEFELLPTGKPHISFSEISDWFDCTWRHKLKHIAHIDLSTTGVALDNGKGLHSSCEDFLRTRNMKSSIAVETIKAAFAENKENISRYVRFNDNDVAYQKLVKEYKGTCTKKEDIIFDYYLTKYTSAAEEILADVPEFMNKTFESWEYIDAEHQLYEKIKNHSHAFKGFIDGIIKCKGARGKFVYWLLDWKTCSWGWTREKKSDEKTKMQLIYYKHYWSKKTGIALSDIRCGFVLLKRDAKPTNHCELIPVSVGNVSSERSLQVINNMFASMNRNMFLKNKMNCKWCEYKNTEHCPGTKICP